MDLSLQRVGTRPRDLHVDEPSLQGRRSLQMHDAKMRSPSGEPSWLGAALDEYLFPSTDTPLVADSLCLLLAVVEEAEPPPFFRRWNVVVEPNGGGPRAWRVLEDEHSFEAHFVHEVDRGLEVLFGLTRVAHDDVRGQSEVGSEPAQECDRLEVRLASIAASHRVQDA